MVISGCNLVVEETEQDGVSVKTESKIDSPIDKTAPRYKTCFSDIEPLSVDMETYSVDELSTKSWYAHKVSFKKGFNPLFIPFTYKCRDGVADPLQSLTFSSLLSLKYDFIDDNICTRHPAFTFQRQPQLRELRIEDVKGSVEAMKYWSMNYCVGGELVQHGELFSGRIVVRDSHGKEILNTLFDPMPYFELMGQMTIAWFNYTNSPVSDLLHKELVRPMCENFSSVTLMGKTFTFEHRSEDEWTVYDQILEQSPEFAEIRWWYANQKSWDEDGIKEWSLNMKLEALEAHLVVSALREAESKPPEARVGRYKKVFDNARKVFPNHSALLNRDRGGSLEKLSRAELIVETEKAFDNSHCFWYANTVADELRDRQMYEYAVPLLLSIINSKYNPGSGNVDAYKQVLDIFRKLGHHRDALDLVTPARNHSKKDGFLLMYLGYLMRDMMLFEQAEKLFRAYVTAHPEQSLGSISLAQTLLDQGKVHELYEFEKTPSWKKIPAKLQKLFKIRAQLQHSDDTQLKEKLLNELYNSRKLFRRDSYTVAFYSIAVIEALLADPDPTTSYYTYLLMLNSIAPNSYYVYQLLRKHWLQQISYCSNMCIQPRT